ncbi:MAG: hypothetical protein KC442_10790 [Thermomicrobiales bacterium]|nr:hypothetical protein [Thermomicrobiales bacterium]
MEDDRFDRLARGVAGSTTRRSTLVGLFGGLALPLAGLSPTDARNRRGAAVHSEKKRKKKCKSGLLTCTVKKGKKKKRFCVDAQNDSLNCGACGNGCATGLICQNGVCACPGGQTSCGGECCSGTQPTCCDNALRASGKSCHAATDVCCPANFGGGACPPGTECCPLRKDGTVARTCLEPGSSRFCCPVNSGGACVAADEECCPPDKTNATNLGCCLVGEACCNSTDDCGPGETCAETGCCR